MSMSPVVRKLALITHISASMGWLGALAVFLAHAIAGLVSDDLQAVRATAIAMGLTAWFVISAERVQRWPQRQHEFEVDGRRGAGHDGLLLSCMAAPDEAVT